MAFSLSWGGGEGGWEGVHKTGFEKRNSVVL